MTAIEGAGDPDEGSGDVHPTKISRDWFPTNNWEQIGERLYNAFVRHFPASWMRVNTLRIFGARIGKGTRFDAGVRILGIQQLVIGRHCHVGTRSFIDARGEVVIGDNVVLERDVHLISGQHVVNSDDFGQWDAPIYLDEGSRVEFRSMVVQGVHIGTGGVVSPCSLVRADVEPMTVVAGVPAVQVSGH